MLLPPLINFNFNFNLSSKHGETQPRLASVRFALAPPPIAFLCTHRHTFEKVNDCCGTAKPPKKYKMNGPPPISTQAGVDCNECQQRLWPDVWFLLREG